MLLVGVPLILAELGWRWRSGRGYDGLTALTTLGLGIGNALTRGVSALAIGGVYALAWQIAPVKWPLHSASTWIAGFFLVEFAYYWFHRASHRVSWMWATHAVHHSAEQLTLLSSIRLGWTNLLSGGWLFQVPLVLMGFDPRLVIGLLVLDLRYQFFLHTEAVGRLGPLEWVFNTPHHHRLHHASNSSYLDRNYGGVVILYDRLFGTLARETGEPIRYGLVHRTASANPLKLVWDEWAMLFRSIGRARGARAKLAVAFGPPA